MTLRSETFDLAAEIAKRFSGWYFKGGEFRNDTLVHTRQAIVPAFNFQAGAVESFSVTPIVAIKNIRVNEVHKRIFGFDDWTATRPFESEFGYPRSVRVYRERFQMPNKPADYWNPSWRTFDELDPLLERIVDYGSQLLTSKFDFSSEVALLAKLPSRGSNTYYAERLRNTQCLVHIAFDDLDYVRRQRADEYEQQNTRAEFVKILDALPLFEGGDPVNAKHASEIQ